MAGILTHLLYAERHDPTNEGFIFGTAIADIDKTRTIDKSCTHLNLKNYKQNPEEEIANLRKNLLHPLENEIFKGILFHSLTEEGWKDNIDTSNYSKMERRALKAWGDELLWKHFQDIPTIQNALRKYKDKVIFPEVDIEAQLYWIDMVIDFIDQNPSGEIRLQIAEKLNIPTDFVTEINTIIDTKFRNDDIINQQLLDNLSNPIEISTQLYAIFYVS